MTTTMRFTELKARRDEVKAVLTDLVANAKHIEREIIGMDAVTNGVVGLRYTGVGNIQLDVYGPGMNVDGYNLGAWKGKESRLADRVTLDLVKRGRDVSDLVGLREKVYDGMARSYHRHTA